MDVVRINYGVRYNNIARCPFTISLLSMKVCFALLSGFPFSLFRRWFIPSKDWSLASLNWASLRVIPAMVSVRPQIPGGATSPRVALQHLTVARGPLKAGSCSGQSQCNHAGFSKIPRLHAEKTHSGVKIPRDLKMGSFWRKIFKNHTYFAVKPKIASLGWFQSDWRIWTYSKSQDVGMNPKIVWLHWYERGSTETNEVALRPMW